MVNKQEFKKEIEKATKLFIELKLAEIILDNESNLKELTYFRQMVEFGQTKYLLSFQHISGEKIQLTEDNK